MLAAYILWLLAIALQTALLVHILRMRLFIHYPFFSLHVVLVWTAEIIRWIIFHQWTNLYPYLYWWSEAFFTGAGFLLVWEAFNHIFKPFPTIRFWVLLHLLLLLVGFLGLHIFLSTYNAINPEYFILWLERWMKFLQALLLASLLLACYQYALPLGRNMFGLILGFGLFLSISVIIFVSQSLGYLTRVEFGRIYAGTYILALIIWYRAFDQFAPNPTPKRSTELEHDYKQLETYFATAWSHLRGGFRKVSQG